jgi:two-component system, LytTR family, response regulator
MIRTLIVDDAPLAREGIRLLLDREKDFEIVGEAADGLEAIAAIGRLAPDLTFLDVQMPSLDGFEVIERCAGLRLGAVVFVTAYDDYALRAFEANALGYLLKPITPRLFQATLQRTRQLLGVPASAEVSTASLRPLTRLVVKEHRRFVLLKAEEIGWITSAGDYVELHARGRSFLVRMTISQLAERLDPRSFARIHRTTIVNLDRVEEIRPLPQGDFIVRMSEGTTLRLSRTYRDQLLP